MPVLVQVRAVMQKKLCRPVPLEMIGSLTVATLRELAAEAGAKSGRPAAQAAPEEVRVLHRLLHPSAVVISLVGCMGWCCQRKGHTRIACSAGRA